MTNREAFNKYLRKEIERKIQFVEAMDNQKLVETLAEVHNYYISFDIGDELNWFIHNWFGRKPDNWKGYADWVRFLEHDNEEKKWE